MSNEQTIYISPEEDLATVRERLEQISTRRLTLVISPQTQLRSYVAWKLLYARARELSKEVVIVSSDPQVRSVAHAVKFKVAHSLETSPATDKPPLASRTRHTSSRAGERSRTSPLVPTRPLSAKNPNQSRNTRKLRGVSSVRHAHTRTPEYELDTWQDDPQHQLQPEGKESGPHTAEAIPGGMHAQPFEVPEKQYSQPYDFRIQPLSSIHPLADHIEEPDLLLEDYTLAQDIRLAAREGQKHFSKTGILSEARHDQQEGEHASESMQPQSLIVDELPTPRDGSHHLPESKLHDAISPEHVHTNEPLIEPCEDIEDLPETERVLEGTQTNEPLLQDKEPMIQALEDIEDLPLRIMDGTLEYQGDSDERMLPLNTKPITYPEAQHGINDNDQDELPLRTYGVRSRRRSSSHVSSTRHDMLREEDALPAIEERVHHLRPSPPPGTRSTGTVPAYTQTSRKARPRPEQGQRPRPTRLVQEHLGPRAMGAGTRERIARSQSSRKTLVGVMIGIVLLLLASLLIYYGPIANVTIGIATQDYSQQVELTANIDKQAQGIQAQQFSKNFTKSGTGTATGSQEVGTNYAQGNVIFTYNGSNPNGIIIPSGSIISTDGGNPVQYATTAEVLLPPSNQNKVPPPVTIQAVKPGKDGNTDANTITSIPDDTLNKIAQAQTTPIAIADLKLTVINDAPITGGGVKATPAVTDQDLSNITHNLHQQVQSQIATWLRQVSSIGAIGPLQTADTLIDAPKVNDIEVNGTFSATLKVTATLLGVRSTDLQEEAIKQLNSTIKKDKSYTGEIILTDMYPVVRIDQLKLMNVDAHTLTFTCNATAKIGPRLITKAYVQHAITGKSISDAKTILIHIPAVKNVDIRVSPSFISWIARWDGHINVTIRPVVKGVPYETKR